MLLACLFFLLPGLRQGSSTDTAKPDAENSWESARSLVLFNWQDYIGSKALAGFEKSTGFT